MVLEPLFIPAGPELLILGGIVVLLFGANKLPELARSVGKSKGELEKGMKESEQELEEIKDEVETELETEQ